MNFFMAKTSIVLLSILYHKTAKMARPNGNYFQKTSKNLFLQVNKERRCKI